MSEGDDEPQNWVNFEISSKKGRGTMSVLLYIKLSGRTSEKALENSTGQGGSTHLSKEVSVD